MLNLVDLVQGDVSLKRYSNRNGGEYRGACPGCGGGDKSDRFIVWSNSGRFWCRQCAKKGDAIQYLRDFRGMRFKEACRVVGRDLPESEKQRVQRERTVRERLMQEYHDWCRARDKAEAEAHGDLWAEIETAEIAYRAITRRPDLYTDAEQSYWQQRLSGAYQAGQQAELRMDEEALQVTTAAYQREQFERWQRERHV